MLKTTNSVINASQITGILPVANGGTGLTTLTSGYVPYGNGTSALNSSSAFQFDGTSLNFGTAGTNGVKFGTGSILSNYETGTWTPTDASGAGLTFTTSNCNYTKIGKLVHVQGSITYPTTSSSATAQFNNLPFAAKGFISLSICYTAVSVANFTYLSGNTTNVFPLTPGTNVTNATLSGQSFTFEGSYETS